MLNGQKIIFVSIVDNLSRTYQDIGVRIWHHQKMINHLLKNSVCLIGRETFELTRWKGPNVWVMTGNRQWRRYGVGTIHDFDDLHLHTEGPIYVIGGTSLFQQLEDYMDEIHIYVINSTDGDEDWIKLNMKDFKAVSYINKNIWSYAHLKKSIGYDRHELNREILDI